MKTLWHVAILALCLFWYCRQTVTGVIPQLAKPSDFEVYHNAARQVGENRSPYNTSEYIYPPLLAFLLVPLGPLDYKHARWLWFAFSQICLLMAAWRIWWAFGRDWALASSLVFVWAFGGAAKEALALGQLGPLLTLLVAFTYTATTPGQTTATACGFALKFVTGAPCLLWLLRGSWRNVRAFALVAVLLLSAPWAYLACCLEGPKTPAGSSSWTGTPAILSWSIPSAVLRIMDPPRAGDSMPHNWEFGNDLPRLRLPPTHRVASILAASMVLLAGTFAVVRRTSPKDPSSLEHPFTLAAVISLALAASPVAWSHYQVLQYPGLALLLAESLKHRRSGLAAATIAAGAFLYPLPQARLLDYYQQYGAWTAASPSTLYFWTTVPSAAALVLAGLLLIAAFRKRWPAAR